MPDPQLRRGLFGYRSVAVRQLLADREAMFQHVAEQARTAEARVGELEAALELAERELDGGAEELGVALREMEGLRSQLDTARLDLAEATATAEKAEAVGSELELTRAERDESLRRTEAAEREASLLRAKLEPALRDAEAASQRATTAELRIRELEAELRAAGRGRRGAVDDRSLSTPASPPTTSDEVARILRSTEEAIARIIEEGKARSEEGLRAAEKARAEALEETRRLKAWLADAAPLVRQVRIGVTEAENRATQLRERLDESLGPIADALSALGTKLDELTRTPQRSDGASLPAVTEGARVIELNEVEATAASAGSDPRGGGGSAQAG